MNNRSLRELKKRVESASSTPINIYLSSGVIVLTTSIVFFFYSAINRLKDLQSQATLFSSKSKIDMTPLLDSIQSLRELNYYTVATVLILILLVWVFIVRRLIRKAHALNHRLYESLVEVENSNRSKSHFLTNMSHEIRTPMTAILGYAEVLSDPDLDNAPKREEVITTIRSNAKHLLGLIDDMLDISKIEAGKFEIKEEEVNLQSIVKDVISLIQVKANEKNLELSLFIDKGVTESVVIDPIRLKQILFNLIGNAIKFTERGYVKVKVKKIDSNKDTPPYLQFFIEDSGLGMDRDFARKAFMPFEQGDSSSRRTKTGAGLGLMLSRGIARSLGGNLTIQFSSPGKGTTMRLVIPYKESLSVISPESESPTKPISEKNHLPLSGVNILLVDDAVENSRLFEIFLNSAGANTSAYNSGAEALEDPELSHYDLILLDIQMPMMDGFEVLREIKSLGIQTPILALTAHAINEEVLKTQQAGFSDHLVKPIEKSELVNSCLKHL